jgi:hypothetical protein
VTWTKDDVLVSFPAFIGNSDFAGRETKACVKEVVFSCLKLWEHSCILEFLSEESKI